MAARPRRNARRGRVPLRVQKSARRRVTRSASEARLFAPSKRTRHPGRGNVAPSSIAPERARRRERGRRRRVARSPSWRTRRRHRVATRAAGDARADAGARASSLPVAREDETVFEQSDGRDERVNLDGDAGARSIPTTRRVTRPSPSATARLPRRSPGHRCASCAAGASVWASDQVYEVNSFANIPTVASCQPMRRTWPTFSHIIMRVLFSDWRREPPRRSGRTNTAAAFASCADRRFASVPSARTSRYTHTPTAPRAADSRDRLVRSQQRSSRRPERHLAAKRGDAARATPKRKGYAVGEKGSPCGSSDDPRRLQPDASVALRSSRTFGTINIGACDVSSRAREVSPAHVRRDGRRLSRRAPRSRRP